MKQTPTLDSDEINISQILQSLWAGKWLIILVAFIAAIISIAHVLTAVPIYTGNALLQIEAKSSGLTGLSGLTAGLTGGGGSETSTELELLKARKVIIPTIKKYNLEIKAKPILFPYIGAYFYPRFNPDNGFAAPLAADIFPSSKNYAWGGEQISVSQFDVPKHFNNRQFHIVALGSNKYRLELNGNAMFEGQIGQQFHDENTNIDILVDKLKARIGTHFSLSRIDSIYAINDVLGRLTVAENGKTSGIVNISFIGPDKQEIKNIINHILLTYQEQNIEYNNIEAGKNIDFIANQLPDAEAKIRKAENLLYEYRLTNETVDLTIKTQQLLDQLLDIEENLGRLKLDEPELSRKFKRQHPLYIEFLERQKNLEAQKRKIEQRTSKIPTEQFNVYRLTRDVELNETIYIQLLNRHEGLKIIQAGTSGSIRVIDTTIVQPRAIKPDKKFIVAISTLAGIMLAMLYLIIRSMFVATLKDMKPLEEAGFKIFGTIAKSPNQLKLIKQKPRDRELRILAAIKPDDLAVEALRGLRTNLSHTVQTADNNIIMIASADAKVGKSFIAQNIAALLAQSGSKTLLIDADLRAGKLHDSIGINNSNGLTDYLTDKVEFENICHQSKIDNLDFISHGGKTSNPSELLMNKIFTSLCQKHKTNYDYIIIDTPSILAFTDAAIIGNVAATSLMVVGKDISQMSQIDLASQRLELAGVKITGYIFNAA